jgi:hypothetical protein
VETLFAETLKKFGTVEVVAQNPGIAPLSPIGKADSALFDLVINVNLRGTFLVLAQAAQHISTSGRIIIPLVACFALAMKETARFAALNGDRVVYLAKVDSAHPIRMFSQIGVPSRNGFLRTLRPDRGCPGVTKRPESPLCRTRVGVPQERLLTAAKSDGG